jgi:hypothetical protein
MRVWAMAGAMPGKSTGKTPIFKALEPLDYCMIFIIDDGTITNVFYPFFPAPSNCAFRLRLNLVRTHNVPSLGRLRHHDMHLHLAPSFRPHA